MLPASCPGSASGPADRAWSVFETGEKGYLPGSLVGWVATSRKFERARRKALICMVLICMVSYRRQRMGKSVENCHVESNRLIKGGCSAVAGFEGFKIQQCSVAGGQL
jgi:hypothetical protein